MNDNFCVYKNNGIWLVGLILNIAKKKYLINDINNKNLYIHPFYSWYDLQLKNITDQHQYLIDQFNIYKKKYSADDVISLYNALEINKPYSVDQIGQKNSMITNGWDLAGLLITIFNEQFHFRIIKKNIIPRDLKSIELLKKNKINLNHEKKVRLLKIKWINSLLNYEYLPPKITSSKNYLQFIDELYNLIYCPKISRIKDYFNNLIGSKINDYFDIVFLLSKILTSTGKNYSWEYILLKRLNINNPVSDDLILKSQNLELDSASKNNSFVDETHLNAFTIDDYYTIDYDDALSWEDNPNSYNLKIHISAVAEFIDANSIFFDESYKRICSIYTPKRSYPMLPKNISSNKLSLIEKEKRFVYTVCWKIDKQFNVLNVKIYKSIIIVKKNLTYQQVDSYINNNLYPWNLIKLFTDKLFSIRALDNTIDTNYNYINLHVDKNNKINLINRNNSAASLMIKELSIQTNYQFAKFISANNFLAIFRSHVVTNNNKNYLYAKYEVEPNIHHGLGLDCYALCTSPLRRFVDLVNQLQIKSIFNNEKQILSSKQILEYIYQIEKNSNKIKNLEININTHYKYLYLAENINESFQLKILNQINTQLAYVQLIKLDLKWETKLVPQRNTIIYIKISSVDIEKHKINFVLE